MLTPPGYRREAARRYPVIYVFPGIGGNEWTYLRALGHDSAMLHTVFSKPELAPIVVFANPGDSGAYGAAEKALAEELVAHVDRTYPTRAEARARSLEGFSLGGVTALTLLTRHPDVFGAAVASSSACYLIARCNRLRAQLRSSPRASNPRVLLSVGAKEGRENRAVSEELARRFGTRVFELAGVGHDWAAQNGAQVDDRAFGQLVGEFHLGRFGS